MSENIQEEIEDKVIDCINSKVNGRLIIYKPEKKIFGEDLVVERRGNYKEDSIYFKVNSLVTPAENISFVKDFPQKSFKSNKNFYLIFAYFDEIAQKINDYIWLVPSSDFEEIADVIKLEDGENSLRFKSSSNFKEKNRYSKFLVDINDLGGIILGALENGKKLTFKETDFEGKATINLDNLKNFLFTARGNTYAADSMSIDNPSLLKSTQLEFQKGDYFYMDISFDGDKKFIGQEIIYQNLKPIWGMNYVGSQIGKIEERFLKESLYKLVEKCRLGQICEYKKREYRYADKGEGSLEEFFGEEQIFLDDKIIYKLDYRGGIISEK